MHEYTPTTEETEEIQYVGTRHFYKEGKVQCFSMKDGNGLVYFGCVWNGKPLKYVEFGFAPKDMDLWI